jgi:hypothetical protein
MTRSGVSRNNTGESGPNRGQYYIAVYYLLLLFIWLFIVIVRCC